MLRRIGAEEGGEFKAIASGTLPSGRPVIVNADGTVSVVGTSAASIGSAVIFESGETKNIGATFDSSNNKVVIAYRDGSNSNYGTAVVGTVSGTSISFGTPVVFESAYTASVSAIYDTNAQKIVIYYRDLGNNQYGTAIVGTVSGTSISFGSANTFYSSGYCSEIAAVYDANAQKSVVAYQAGNDSAHGYAIVGTVSGTSISFGSQTEFENAVVSDIGISFDSSANKVVIAYRDHGNSNYGTAIVGTVSSTSISFGSAAVFETSAIQYTKNVYDSGNNKTNIFYMDGGDSDKGKAVIGTVSGTSISFTTPETFYDAAGINALSAVYDSNAAKSVIGIRGASAYGLAIPITSDGSSFTIGSSTTITTNAYGTFAASVFDSNEKKVIFAYQDGDDSDKGKAQVYNAPAPNITSENYIGMSRGVAVQTGSADSVGSETEFVSNMGNEISAGVYDPDSSKVVLAYADQGNSIRGTAVVGTVSGTSISFGTPVNFETVETTHIGITYDTTNDKVVIVYRDGASNNNYGTAIVGTVSGTSISFGTEAVYNTALSQYNSAAFDSNAGKVVIAYKDSDSSVQSRVATVSGTSISFGTEVQVTSNGTYIKAVFDSNSNKVVVIYRDGGNSNYGTARVGTVSGTDISFGSAVVFASSSTEDIQAAFDSTNNKIVIGYKDGGDSDKGKTVVGTVSGTSISFGSAVTFNTGGSFGMNGVVYNSNQNKVFFFYTSGATGNVLSGTVSGTAVGSLSSEFTYHNASTGVPFQIYDVASTNIVAAYRDGADSKGKAVVFKPDNIATTRGQVTNGQAASVDVIGSVSTNQIGLTAGQQYFVQNDGTISTTADSPSVLAGTAISATELVVKT